MSVLFDPSILPGCSNDPSEAVIPGTKIYPLSEGYRAGLGCYEVHGFVFSSLSGYVHSYDSKDAVSFYQTLLKLTIFRREKISSLLRFGKIIMKSIASCLLLIPSLQQE